MVLRQQGFHGSRSITIRFAKRHIPQNTVFVTFTIKDPNIKYYSTIIVSSKWTFILEVDRHRIPLEILGKRLPLALQPRQLASPPLDSRNSLDSAFG